MAHDLRPEQQPVFFRLDPSVYANLEKQCAGPACPKTDLEAGFLLGIQHVLKKLRDGYTTER